MHRQGPRERRVGGLAGSEWGGYILRAPGCSLEVKIRGLWVGTQQTRRTCSRIAAALAAGSWAALTLCGCGGTPILLQQSITNGRKQPALT